MEKECVICGDIYKANSNAQKACSSECKNVLSRIAIEKYIKEHGEEKKERDRLYIRANSEKNKIRAKEWRKNKKEHIKEYNRKNGRLWAGINFLPRKRTQFRVSCSPWKDKKMNNMNLLKYALLYILVLVADDLIRGFIKGLFDIEITRYSFALSLFFVMFLNAKGIIK